MRSGRLCAAERSFGGKGFLGQPASSSGARSRFPWPLGLGRPSTAPRIVRDSVRFAPRHSTTDMALLMVTSPRVPVLCAGDRLTRDEFERRYSAMPDLKKAELIEGVVYMGSPVSLLRHGHPHLLLAHWLGIYQES